MTLVLGFTGSATSFTAGSLAAVTTGSSLVQVRFKNVSEVSLKAWFRPTGTTGAGEFVELNPGASSGGITLAIGVAKTIDYYVEGGGSVECWIVDYGGSGIVPPFTVDIVISWLEMHGYTISATGDLTSAQVQLCLDSITAQVTVASSRFTLIAGYAINAALKNDIILKGTVAQALFALRNQGASAGLIQEKVIIAETTANKYQAEYEKAINDMTNGLNLGA